MLVTSSLKWCLRGFLDFHDFLQPSSRRWWGRVSLSRKEASSFVGSGLSMASPPSTCSSGMTNAALNAARERMFRNLIAGDQMDQDELMERKKGNRRQGRQQQK